MNQFVEGSFEIVEDLSKLNKYTQSRRFNSYHIVKDNTHYSFKQALQSDSKPMLANEVAFNRYIETTDIGVRAPKVISYVDDTAIFSWIDAPLLVHDEYTGPLSADQIDAMVFILISMRSLPVADFAGTAPKTPAGELDALFDVWSLNPLRDGMLSAQDLEQARAITRESSRRGFLQHGDLTFSHVFADRELTIYDTEHASNLHDEFADFAHVYSSYYARNPNEPSLGALVEKYAQALGVTRNVLFDNAHPVMMANALARLNDSLNDRLDEDYREGAVRLFDSVLNSSFPN